MDWIDLAQGRYKWRPVLNMIMKVIQNAQSFLASWRTARLSERDVFLDLFIYLLSCMVNYTHTQQVRLCGHNTDDVHVNKHSINIPGILAWH